MLSERAPRWVVVSVFEDSLLWRDQSRFTDRTFHLAQEILGGEGTKAVLLKIATEPGNRFNALFLHERLSALAMPERDQLWSVFIAGEGNDESGPVGTLIGWSLHRGMDEIEEDRAELAAITLTWCLSTSSRNVRDRATKALACLLASRLPLACRLIERFQPIDDLYVTERLFAAIYGAVMQGYPTTGLSELAEAVYQQVFAGGVPPVILLLREHAAGIIQYVGWRGLLPASVNVAATQPPYNSPWPIEYVPETLIESYTEDYGKGQFRDAIVGSTGSFGDFRQYVIERVIRHWNLAPIGERLLDSGQIYRLWLKEFSRSATESQVNAFIVVFKAAKDAKGNVSWQDTPEKAKLQAAEAVFRATLTSDAWEDYCVRAQGFIHHEMFATDWRNRHIAPFNLNWASRWICKRAHELGWTTERFSKFDRWRGRGADRHNHRVERIGKKYQWLALYELTARMADNLAYRGDSYGPSNRREHLYRSARDVGLRNIDPSLLVEQTHYDGWKQWPRTWWMPMSASLHPMSAQERLAWRDSDRDILNDSSLIDVTNPKDGRRWFVLHSFGHWRDSTVVNGHRAMQRETWFRLDCIVVRSRDAVKLERHLKTMTLTDRHQLPTFELHDDHYLGEYAWHPSLGDRRDWWPAGGYGGLPVPTRPTVAEYSCERGGYDYSIIQSINLQMPAPWLLKAMDLRLVNGRALTYATTDGRVMFFDPSASQNGPAAALVDRDAFLAVLAHGGLTAIWVIAGEKSVYGSADPGAGFGGRIAHSFIYRMKNGHFVRNQRFDRNDPSPEQLRKFLSN